MSKGPCLQGLFDGRPPSWNEPVGVRSSGSFEMLRTYADLALML